MKPNEFIFEHFAPISKKQWKQKIQFQLNGADYQTNLVKNIAEGVNTLPFYTYSDLEKILDYPFTIRTSKTICIEVNDETKANAEAKKHIKQGVQAIYFICFSKNIDGDKLLQDIEIPVVINCQFLDTTFLQKSNAKKNIHCLFDPIGKLSTTGNWYRSQENDFRKLHAIVNKNNSNTAVSIALTLFENAGADYIQQLAYSICQFKDYVAHQVIKNKSKVHYIVSVSTEIYHEISKLKGLRILHAIVAENLNMNVSCSIILVKSKRNIRATDHIFNTIMQQTEQLIGFAGQADHVCSPTDSNYFTDVDLDQKDVEINHFLNTDFEEQRSEYNQSLFTEKLSQEFVEKALQLIENIDEGNGYLVQFKKGIIPQKIFKKALKEQKKYAEEFEHSATATFLKNKKAIQYPFFKKEDKKTQYKPIVQKRLHAPLEKPYWDQFFNNE